MGAEGHYCQYITLEELESAFQTANKHGQVKDISTYKINNKFDPNFVPLKDNVSGIHGMVPPEGLHNFGNGLYETMIDTIHNIIGLAISNKKDKEKVDNIYLLVVEGMN